METKPTHAVPHNNLPPNLGLPFAAPEGYFAALPSRVMAALPPRRRKPVRAALPGLWAMPSLLVAAALALTLIANEREASFEDIHPANAEAFLLDEWNTDGELLLAHSENSAMLKPAALLESAEVGPHYAMPDTPRVPAQIAPTRPDSAEANLVRGLDHLLGPEGGPTDDVLEELWLEIGDEDVL